jgi:CelD/BcsL family acetyltransferase involved in cellulose biosynthesis
VRLETIHPKELGPAELARWRAHQRADIGMRSPYLTPEWAQLTGGVRDDARVCIIDDGAAFLGVQRLSRFSAMGLGAPIADYQGIVGVADVDGKALCRALKVGRIDLSHVPAGATPLSGAGAEGSWIAETCGGRDLYEAALRRRRSEFVRQTDKKTRKLARDHGHVEFRANTPDMANFETLLAWKNAQLTRSGQPSIWATPWIRQALEQCFESRATAFGGVLFTLSIDQRLVAAAFCLRSASVLHFWLLAHDSEFDRYSPGVVLARWAVGWASENGIAEVDFGPGDYQYKRQLSTTQRTLRYGVISGASISSALRSSAYELRQRIERFPTARFAALPGKAMRRLDLRRAL